jgi:endonuclease/exonuclease/phosphatase family metal-dependent hydrolase
MSAYGIVAAGVVGLAGSAGSLGCGVVPDGDREERTSTTTAAVDGVCGSEPLLPPFGNSIRLVSFNSHLLSPWFGMASSDAALTLPATTSAKAEAIAAALRVGTFDVIALNEAWDEDDGKDILVSKLCPTYPNYVRSIDADLVTEERPEDSGLMVFSKLPFAALPNSDFAAVDSESSLGDDSPDIAFTRFDSCTGIDCMASKGAMMVRLAHPSSGRILNLVATHFDAQETQARVGQMLQIRGKCDSGQTSDPNLITTSLGMSLAPDAGLCRWTNAEWLAITGDLNIPGQGAVRANVHPGTAGIAGVLPEWESHIGTPAANASSTGWALYDAWAETTSPGDIGLSHRGDQARLDYILAARRTPSPLVPPTSAPDMCVQRIWSPPELDGISDHQPVAADLNRMMPQCNPRLAYNIQPTDVSFPNVPKGSKPLTRSIGSQGSMQWFRFALPGTYIIALEAPASAGLTFETFTPDNLSVPASGARVPGGGTVLSCTGGVTGSPMCKSLPGTKIVAPRGPFFIRVFATNRAFSGPYNITIYKSMCAAPDDACVLLPNVRQPFQFPPDAFAAWFQVRVIEQADSGAAQSLRFHVDQANASTWGIAPQIKFFNSLGTAEATSLFGVPFTAQQGGVNAAGRPRVFRTVTTASNVNLLMRVQRMSDAAPMLEIGWQTNLTLVGALKPTGTNLVCLDETNPETGRDDIQMRAGPDGSWGPIGTGSFDCNSSPHSQPWGTKFSVRRVLTSLGIALIEEDLLGDDASPAFEVPLLPLDAAVTGITQQSMTWNWADGTYRFDYFVGKWRE